MHIPILALSVSIIQLESLMTLPLDGKKFCGKAVCEIVESIRFFLHCTINYCGDHLVLGGKVLKKRSWIDILFFPFFFIRKGRQDTRGDRSHTVCIINTILASHKANLINVAISL